MATITTTGSGNWSSTTADAPWPGGTKPTTGDVVEIAAGHTVTLDEDTPTLGAAGIKNVSGSNTSVLDVSGTRTISGCVSYSGTATTGFITLGTGDGLTITYGGGAGTSAVSNSGSGYAIASSSNAAVTISNSGGTALSVSNGRGLDHNSTGAVSITGEVAASNGRAVQIRGAATNCTTVGNAACSATGTALYIQSGSMSLDGNISHSSWSAGTYTVTVAGGTLTWFGNRTLGANTDALLYVGPGTLTLSGASDRLQLANSGRFVLMKASGTLTATGGAAGDAVIANQSAAAQATVLGQAVTVTGASVPSAADTRYGVTRGWADGGTSATTGVGVAGGNGTLSVPNSGTQTGTEDATSDACVVSGKNYGAGNARTGSAAGGGGIWMPRARQVGV